MKAMCADPKRTRDTDELRAERNSLAPKEMLRRSQFRSI